LPYTASGSSVTQPTNPPFNVLPNGQGSYISQTIELTQPYNSSTPNVYSKPTIDVSEVDGFSVPINVTLNGGLQVGQPTYASGQSATINRQSIMESYSTWVSANVPSGLQAAYNALYANTQTVDNQAVNIVNPGTFLTNGGPGSATLDSTFNTTLTTLFTSSNLVGLLGPTGDYYQGTPNTTSIGGQTYNVLDFVGYTDSACTNPNGYEFYIFSPLNEDPGAPNQGETSGTQVFANNGVFADDSGNTLVAYPTGQQGNAQSIVLALEVQLVEALNRGVALQGGTSGTAGSNSLYWNTETNWYPTGQTFNYFSWFMHTAQVSNSNIFLPPPSPAQDAQGNTMGQTYGFAYDESPNFVATPPNVPSKFDPVPDGTTTATVTFTPWTSTTPTPPPAGGGKYFVVGTGFREEGEARVYRRDSNGHMQLVKTLKPFGTFFGGVRVATGDVNGDGVDDIICAQGPSGNLQVKVFDGKTFDRIDAFRAFPQKEALRKHIGVFVASADVNNDGYADIVVGADQGWQPEVCVYSGKDGSLLTHFMAFGRSLAAGGARVSAGDINKDGFADIVVGSGRDSLVHVYDGQTFHHTLTFNPFSGTSNHLGVFVAIGDMNGDGVLDLVAGTGGSVPAKARYFNATNGHLIDTVFSLPSHYESAILGTFDWDNDGQDDLMCTLGPGMPGHIRVWEHTSGWHCLDTMKITNDRQGIWLS
jgi:hypothetical protein